MIARGVSIRCRNTERLHSRPGTEKKYLLGNALTHGGPTSRLSFTRDGSFELWVANAGEPIPEAAMKNLFEQFFRGEARASRQGLGLGLYIASQIAKAHDGALTVTSSPTETRFTFTMPSE